MGKKSDYSKIFDDKNFKVKVKKSKNNDIFLAGKTKKKKKKKKKDKFIENIITCGKNDTDDVLDMIFANHAYDLNEGVTLKTISDALIGTGIIEVELQPGDVNYITIYVSDDKVMHHAESGNLIIDMLAEYVSGEGEVSDIDKQRAQEIFDTTSAVRSVHMFNFGGLTELLISTREK